MELIKKGPTYQLTIGYRSVRLTQADLRELADLADEAIREAEKPADDIPLYTQILKLRPHCRLVVPKAYGYQSVNGTCSMVRRRHNIPVHTTKMKFSGDIVVYRR